MSQTYKYELHCHTSESSRCASSTGAEMADFYKKAGYTGLIITDHFLNGNTTVPKDLDWEERIELYCKGYENAKKRGDEIGLDVFFGWEFNGDFVTLGLDKEWLKAHKDLDKLSRNEYFDLIHANGGYLIHAHPYRMGPYARAVHVTPMKVDALEVINSQNQDFQNKMAEYTADLFGVTKVCGSDKHSATVLKRVASLELDFRPESLEDLLDAIRENRHTVKEYSISEVDGELVLADYVPEIFV